MRDVKRGHLSIGASTAIGIYLLPDLLGHYRSRYPHIELSLEIANAEAIQERLLANNVDVGLVEGSVTSPELYREFWQHDELVLIAVKDHSLIRRQDLQLEELLAENVPFLVREPGSGTREAYCGMDSIGVGDCCRSVGIGYS